MKVSVVMMVVAAVWMAAAWGLQDVSAAGTPPDNDERPTLSDKNYLRHILSSVCVPPQACSSLPDLPHKATTLPCAHHNPLEVKCPSKLKLCCKIFQESHLEISSKIPATSPSKGSQAGNEDSFSDPEYTADCLQAVQEQEIDPSVDTTFQGDLHRSTNRIASSQSQQYLDKNKIKNTIQTNISEKELQTSILHSDFHIKDSLVTEKVLQHEAVLQSTHQGTIMTNQNFPAPRNHDVHEVLEPHQKTTNERENSEESVNIEKDYFEQESSSPSDAVQTYHEMEEPSHSKYSTEISPHAWMVDNKNIPSEGSHSLEHTGKVSKNGVRNSPEAVIDNDHCLGIATTKRFLKNYDQSYRQSVGSLNRNGFLVQSDSTQNGSYKANVSSATNRLSDCKHNNISFDDSPSSQSYTFHSQVRRRRNLRRESVLADEQATLLHEGQINGVPLDWRTHGNKYHPIEIYLSTDRQISPIYSSVLLEKGIAFTVFFWVYLVAFLYTACYIVSPFTTSFSIFGVILKVLLVYCFPAIIQLEVFRAVDYIMVFIFKYT